MSEISELNDDWVWRVWSGGNVASVVVGVVAVVTAGKKTKRRENYQIQRGIEQPPLAMCAARHIVASSFKLTRSSPTSHDATGKRFTSHAAHTLVKGLDSSMSKGMAKTSAGVTSERRRRRRVEPKVR